MVFTYLNQTHLKKKEKIGNENYFLKNENKK